MKHRGISRREYYAQLRAAGRVPGGPESKVELERLGLANNKHANTEARFAAAHALIVQEFPGFTAQMVSLPEGRQTMRFTNYPLIAGKHPSLADLARQALIRRTFRPQAPTILKFDRISARHAMHLGDLGEVAMGQEFAELIESLPAIFPDESMIPTIASWLLRGKEIDSGLPFTSFVKGYTVFTPVCPDWKTAIVDGVERYTFEGLGEGIGLVARRALTGLSKFWEWAKQHNFNIRFVVAIGDSEADSEENLQRAGISADEFRLRCRKSQEAFRKACPVGMPIETPLFSEIGNGLWGKAVFAAREGLKGGKIPGLTGSQVSALIRARLSLYRRWYGEDLTEDGAYEVLLRQAPDYIAIRDLVRPYGNTLVLGADAAVMASLINAHDNGTPVPVISLRTPDY